VDELSADPEPILATAREDTGQSTEDLRFAFERIMAMLAGSMDASTEHESFRAIGDAAARDGLRAAYVLDRYLSLAWAIWAAVEPIESAGRDEVHAFGDRLLRGMDRSIAAMAEGYRAAAIELARRLAIRHRAVLDELLGSAHATPAERDRLRRSAHANGIDPDGHFRIVVIGLAKRSYEELQESLVRLAPVVGATASELWTDPTIRFPQLIEWRGRLVLFAEAAWGRDQRLLEALERERGDGWTAVDTGPLEGIEAVASAVVEADYALGIAARLDRRGWIETPSALALEAAFLVDEKLVLSAVEHELGPILDDRRMGRELIETLRVYLDSRQSIAETARRLGVAPRTVTNRLRRIEDLLERELSDGLGVRLGAALMALEVTRSASGDDRRSGRGGPDPRRIPS
jgi:hypothetical protein